MFKLNRLSSTVRHLCGQPSVADPVATANKYVDIPRPPSLPLFGTKLALIAAGGGNRLHEYVDRRHRQLGNTFCEHMAGADIVFTSDPEYLRTLFIKLEGKYPMHILPESWIMYNNMYGTKRGLFFMDGEEWLHNRKILNKLILKENSESWMEVPIKEVTTDLVNKWSAMSKDGVLQPKLDHEFYRFSIDVLVSVLIGSSKSFKTKEYDFLLEMFAEAVQKIFKFTSEMYVWPSLYAKLNLPAWRNFKESVDTSLTLSRKLVSEITSRKCEYSDGLISKLIQENVPEENITRIIADFIIAAGDTTSYTMLWTLYLLSKKGDIVKELRQTNNMKYVHNVVKESMRLYPVAPFLTRIIPKECKLGPYNLAEGTPIVGSIYTSGRSAANFSKPEEFIPQRWEHDEGLRTLLPLHTPSATLPFAIGARSCIGRKIAQLQLVHAIKSIIDNFDMKLLNKKEVDAITSLVLVPKDPIKIQFKVNNSAGMET